MASGFIQYLRYLNGPGRNDEARLRNFIIGHDLVRAIAFPKGMKAEAHRLGFEMSEDALSWNVFESLALAGKLREATQFLTGRKLRGTPHLYLWGRRIDDPNDEIHEPLRRVRARLEPDIRTFVGSLHRSQIRVWKPARSRQRAEGGGKAHFPGRVARPISWESHQRTHKRIVILKMHCLVCHIPYCSGGCRPRSPPCNEDVR